jgi:hypothetical protein
MRLYDLTPPLPEPKSAPEMILRAPRRCVESNSSVTLAYVIYPLERVRTLSQADGCTYIQTTWTAGPLSARSGRCDHKDWDCPSVTGDRSLQPALGRCPRNAV